MTVASARTDFRRRSESSRTPARRRIPQGTLVAGGVALVLGVPAAAAAETPSPEPTYRIEIGAEERIRTENWDNLSDFDSGADDTRHQWRFRSRVWSKLHLGSRHLFTVGLNNESRRVTTPDTKFAWDEVIFETLCLESKLTEALGVRIGRENIMRNDGWLVFEGGPLDGSRAMYFNALDATWTHGTSKLELLVISDPSRDEYLPRINDQDKLLIEWDEFAAGLWYTNTTVSSTTLEGYWFWKQEWDDVRPVDNAQHQPDRDLHTLGGRGVRKLPHGWSVTVDAAAQLGSQDPDADIRAWGTQAIVEKAFAHPTKPTLALSWVGLSGDDPRSATVEGWDPLFARWPKWSELYLYTLASERGVAYWTNLAMGRLKFEITPWKPLQVRASWSRLGAFETFAGKPSVYGTGKLRGDLLELRADFKVNDSLRGHLLGERFDPGSFYAGSDAAWFVRAEIIASYAHTFGL